uniref:Uncharacterized protein n=1 Tax=Leptobrachium leishanense TaxID=445787 RepID=A0A8C5M8H6_9ANUR
MASNHLAQELTCSICKDIHRDPVFLTCQHHVCQACITDTVDSQQGYVYSNCPVCTAEFLEDPIPSKIRKTDNIVETVHPTWPPKKDDGIYCTYCVHALVHASKTCLLCEASLCEIHLRVHCKSAEHIITKPTTSFANKKCHVHQEILKYYCTNDDTCICVSCRLDGDHKGHRVETLKEASEKKKEKLKNVLETLASDREKAEERVQSLKERRSEVEDGPSEVTEQVTDLIGHVREQLEVLEKRVLSEISRQKRQISLPFSDLIHQLEAKNKELSRKMSYIKDLCKVTDPLTVLQGQESNGTYYCYGGEGDNKVTEGTEKEVHSVGDLDVGLISATVSSELGDLVMEAKRKQKVNNSSEVLLGVNMASDMFLDVDTAGNYVTVSGDLRTVSWSEVHQCHPEMTRRFQNNQVLSIIHFSSGRHYWEVETSETGGWRVGMTYPSIERKGDHSVIGYNNKSWSLRRWNNRYSVIYDKKVIRLSHSPSCQRLGIYLDYEAGQLSFYELCSPIKPLHSFSATFTEPLHAAIGIWKNTWLRIKN